MRVIAKNVVSAGKQVMRLDELQIINEKNVINSTAKANFSVGN